MDPSGYLHGNYPNLDNPPPQYTPTPAAPGSSNHYPQAPHPDVSRHAHPQSLDTYNNSQAMIPSPYGYDTGPYPAESNHGHYASAPRPDQTFHDFRAPETGPHRAYRDPRVSDPGSYEAYGDPHASNRGPYRAYRDPHAADTGSYQTYHVPHASGSGPYPAFHGPHVSETRPYVQRQSFPSSSPPANGAYFPPSDVGLHSGASQPPEYGHNWHPRSSPSQPGPSPTYRAPEYPSSQAPEKQRYHSPSDARRDGDTLPAEKSAARARGGDARADASNAILVSDFVREHLFRCRAPTDLSPTLCRRWFVIFVVEVINSQGISFRIKLSVLKSLPTFGSWGSLSGSLIFAPR